MLQENKCFSQEFSKYYVDKRIEHGEITSKYKFNKIARTLKFISIDWKADSLGYFGYRVGFGTTFCQELETNQEEEVY